MIIRGRYRPRMPTRDLGTSRHTEAMVSALLSVTFACGVVIAVSHVLNRSFVAPVYDVEQLTSDPQVLARDTITTVEDEDLGPLKMQNVMFRMGGTPCAIRFPGRRLGQDNPTFYRELGLSHERITDLHNRGVI